MLNVNLRNETKVGLLWALKDFTERVTGDLKLPVKQQSKDERAPEPRTASVYMTRLPDMNSFDRKAPFILHQVVSGLDDCGNTNEGTGQQTRLGLRSICAVRTVFCVYNPDEQEGGLSLLNLMEEMRMAILMYPILNDVFELDMQEGISQRVYPETGERGTAPFYLGEMVTTWKLPPIQRLDAARVVRGLPPKDPNAKRTDSKIP